MASGSCVFKVSRQTLFKCSSRLLYENTCLPSRTSNNLFKTFGTVNKNFDNSVFGTRMFGVDVIRGGSAARAETTSTIVGLSKLQAQELVLRLTDDERAVLVAALEEYDSKRLKEEFQAERIPRPTTKNLVDMAVANSIPFIGFGFLDNFFMLIFGDYIDIYLGSYFFLSTMAAAALGNTFSDVLGIGTAFYVERMANKVGFCPPKLTPAQLDMPISRNFANLGRVIGVTIGCLLGMVPLLFFDHKDDDETKDNKSKNKK
ncbi:transmembrane protein 65 isoform X2 [Onthophagus taurus]|uniref:transmembrane protein 65 isoform X2 n=1 Tax=Onthophagus taurus TaxID=166361 RepID=UPI000C1FEDDD|nr:transmembrane protein 65 isoform X2 [Onthophagus taurus]